MGRSSSMALSNASCPHGYQSTGLFLCCNRYGLDSFANLFTNFSFWFGEFDSGCPHRDVATPKEITIEIIWHHFTPALVFRIPQN